MITSWSKQLDASSALSSTFGYDSADQLISASVPLASGPTPQAYQYQYDLAGNRTSEQIDPVVTSSSYNNLNQLLSQAGGGNMVFNGKLTSNNNPVALTLAGQPASVDTSGNWRGAAPVTVGSNSIPLVATDANGKTTTKTITIVVSGGAARTLTFDANGNLSNDGNGKTFTYDARNRLVSVTQTSGVTGFVYDGKGRRVQETLNGTLIKQWVWCGAQPCEERDASNNVTKRFYSQGEQIGGVNFYTTHDHLGSIREMTDSTGAIRARYDYDSYGRQTKLSGDLDADFGFTGFYHDQATGLDFSRTRPYMADLGRWLSRDPIGENGGLNLYDYVANDPINAVDPLGLCDDLKKCMDNFLRQNYGNITANTLVPEFSAYSYIPGMGANVGEAWKSTVVYGALKASVVGVAWVFGQHMMENSHGLSGVWEFGEKLPARVTNIAEITLGSLAVYSTAAQTAAFISCSKEDIGNALNALGDPDFEMMM